MKLNSQPLPDLRLPILQVFEQVASDSGKELELANGDETILLESGLDSLDFAIAVARLEDMFSADPFAALDEPVYPRTLREFVAVYEAHFDRLKSFDERKPT